jgi:hypothetical protein
MTVQVNLGNRHTLHMADLRHRAAPRPQQS